MVNKFSIFKSDFSAAAQRSLFLFLLCINTLLSYGVPLSPKCFDNQQDFSHHWWLASFKNSTNAKVFAIKTSHYTLSFDYPKLTLQNLMINTAPTTDDVVMRETNAVSIPTTASGFQLQFGTDVNGTVKYCTKTTGNIYDCQMVELGKYFQRRFMNKLTDLAFCNIYNSGLEIASWPDRISFILRATPDSNLVNTGLVMNLSFPTAYSVLLQSGDVKALKNPLDGSGYIILKSANTTSISVVGNKVTALLANKALCTKKVQMNVGLIVYPVAANIDAKLSEIAEQESGAVTVTATQKAPILNPITVSYDKDMGCHKITLRGDNSPNSSSNDTRMEKLEFTMTNSATTDKTVRLNFEKINNVPGITGLSAMLRDLSGYPIGIPVQLSKNWHVDTSMNSRYQYYRGYWYRGLTMLTLPAKSTLTLEYTSVNALWGNLPAASHGQLSLVGYNGGQQWSQAALGSWGESICYDPDNGLAASAATDFRPLMIKHPKGTLWQWTGNMGGADFCNYTKTTGSRSWPTRMRTQYKKYSPNLTEVVFAGTTDDNTMDFEYSTSMARSNDMVRCFYHIKMKVLKNVTFKDFVVFQAASAGYHYTKSATLGWGNETGLVKEWPATIGTVAKYTTTKAVVTGTTPWFSFTNSDFDAPSTNYLPANRGFIIRSWKARINGQNNIPPYFAEYNAVGGHGNPSGIINITPPTTCTSFVVGDSIDAVIELFQIPKAATDYYGLNQNLINALTAKANTWEMVYRESKGNDLKVTALQGKVINNYPIKIEASNDAAQFSVVGGRGYVPLTITNVSTYVDPKLYQKVNGVWVKVDQSFSGNDYWQTDYNPTKKNWEITYNVNLDSPNDVAQTVEYRFYNTPTFVVRTELGNEEVMNAFTISPNPSLDGNCQIHFSDYQAGDVLTVRVLNLQSRLVFEKTNITAADFNLQASLKSGVYFVVVIRPGKSDCVKKLVVR